MSSKKKSKDLNLFQFWSTSPMVIQKKNPKNGLVSVLKIYISNNNDEV